jgi:hypothetical protein
LRSLISALGVVMCGAVVASACGSSSAKKRNPTYGGEGGGAGEAAAPVGGEGGVSLGGQGGASAEPVAGASAAGVPGAGGQAGPPVSSNSGTGLSLPGTLKFDISCGTASVQATLSLTNWGDSDIELTAGEVAGAYTLETALPLTVASGESVDVVVSTAPGVVGTDAPGDKRQGRLTLTSNLGTALIQLDGAIGGAKLELDSIPGAPLVGGLSWSCASTAEGCGSKTFTIVNTGASNAVLHPPVGDTLAVAAFIPGSQESLTLEPGAAVRVEVRPGANGDVEAASVDKISIPVDGSCDVNAIEVPVLNKGPEACQCKLAPPGIEASQPVLDYSCGSAAFADVTLFNASASSLDVSAVVDESDAAVPVENTLPFSVESGKSAVLKVLATTYPSYPGTFRADFTLKTNLGDLPSEVVLHPHGGSALLTNAFFNSVPDPLTLNNCTPLELWITNYNADAPITVSPPVVTGGLAISGFSTPQTLQPGAKVVFSVAAVSNAGNSCATTGKLEFALDGECAGPKLVQNFAYSGACTCNGT